MSTDGAPIEPQSSSHEHERQHGEACAYEVPEDPRSLVAQTNDSRFGHTTHLWLGVSIETNDVRKRIDVLREIKRRHNLSSVFLSVEPLIGQIDACDFTDMDWVLIGGESEPGCRRMQCDWLKLAIAKSRYADAAI